MAPGPDSDGALSGAEDERLLWAREVGRFHGPNPFADEPVRVLFRQRHLARAAVVMGAGAFRSRGMPMEQAAADRVATFLRSSRGAGEEDP